MRRFLRVPTIYVLSKNKKIVKTFQLKIVIFTAVKNRCILHGCVFVMENDINNKQQRKPQQKYRLGSL